MKDNNRTTIIEQSFNNEKPMNDTNETRQLNRAMENNIETQQRHTEIKNNKRGTM
jgi:hypothetical protein